MGVESFGSGALDREYLARRREQMRQLREQAGVADDDTPDVGDLWYIEDRTDLTEWFADRGWDVSAIDAADLMTRYGRAAAEDTTPRTDFVEAKLAR